jgi:hypothetical protein
VQKSSFPKVDKSSVFAGYQVKMARTKASVRLAKVAPPYISHPYCAQKNRVGIKMARTKASARLAKTNSTYCPGFYLIDFTDPISPIDPGTQIDYIGSFELLSNLIRHRPARKRLAEEKRLADKKITSYEYIGAIVEKKFKIGVFRGTVDRFELSELDDGSLAPIFHVTYTDDDTEEFLLEGLKKILVDVVTQNTNVAPAEAEVEEEAGGADDETMTVD